MCWTSLVLSQNKNNEKIQEKKPIKIVYQDDQSCTLAHAATLHLSNHGKKNPNQQTKNNQFRLYMMYISGNQYNRKWNIENKIEAI